jgi:hypothetical protein
MIPPSALLAFIKPKTDGLETANENMRNAFEGGAAKMLEERIKQQTSLELQNYHTSSEAETCRRNCK